MCSACVACISIVRSDKVRVFTSYDVKNAIINLHCTEFHNPKITIVRADQAED